MHSVVTFKRTIYLALFKYLNVAALSGFTCPDYQNYGQHWGPVICYCHNIKEAFDKVLSSEQYVFMTVFIQHGRLDWHMGGKCVSQDAVEMGR